MGKPIIMPCGDRCDVCPRYTVQSPDELRRWAEIWYKLGWSDRLLSPEEMICTGCASHKFCSFGLIDCMKEKKVQKCNQCSAFPCEKIKKMLGKVEGNLIKCREVCTDQEFTILSEAFFEKEQNLRR